MPTSNFQSITVGGPCKIVDGAVVVYFEDGVKLDPKPVWREVKSDVAGDEDDTLVDLTYEITGRPKAIWNATMQGELLPSAYTNWSTAGVLMCGLANRTVSIIGSDSNGFDFTRCVLTEMPGVFMGLGEPLYDTAKWTAFLGQGKALTDPAAFYATNTTAWSQVDFPVTNQEAEATAAWGAVAGWDTVFAEKGFKLTHELKKTMVKQGNITVDHRIQSYRGMISFTPEEPTTAQLLSAFNLQNVGGGIGTRRSALANDFVVTASGLSVTLKSAGLNKGQFIFDSKANRHGEFAMITSLATPGTRLVLV